MSIEVQGIRRSFGAFNALDGVSLHVSTGELVALVGAGASGQGRDDLGNGFAKSTARESGTAV